MVSDTILSQLISNTNTCNMFETTVNIGDNHRIDFRFNRNPIKTWTLSLGKKLLISIEIITKNKDEYIELLRWVIGFFEDYISLQVAKK